MVGGEFVEKGTEGFAKEVPLKWHLSDKEE